MADKGILFSAPMVRALLDGRKTQTRRIITTTKKPMAEGMILRMQGPQFGGTGYLFDPPYRDGDRLWVREEWSIYKCFDGIRACDVKAGSHLFTRADGLWNHGGDIADAIGRRRASMHMPRKLSRITLTVTDVRVERLHSISKADAIAEGLEPTEQDGTTFWIDPADFEEAYENPILAYHSLWNSLHAADGTTWADNPWVVAVSFNVNKGNIDASS